MKFPVRDEDAALVKYVNIGGSMASIPWQYGLDHCHSAVRRENLYCPVFCFYGKRAKDMLGERWGSSMTS